MTRHPAKTIALIATLSLAATTALVGCAAPAKGSTDTTCAQYMKMSSSARAGVASAVLKEVEFEDTFLTNQLMQKGIIAYCSATDQDEKISEGMEMFKKLKEQYDAKK